MVDGSFSSDANTSKSLADGPVWPTFQVTLLPWVLTAIAGLSNSTNRSCPWFTPSAFPATLRPSVCAFLSVRLVLLDSLTVKPALASNGPTGRLALTVTLMPILKALVVDTFVPFELDCAYSTALVAAHVAVAVLVHPGGAYRIDMMRYRGRSTVTGGAFVHCVRQFLMHSARRSFSALVNWLQFSWKHSWLHFASTCPGCAEAGGHVMATSMQAPRRAWPAARLIETRDESIAAIALSDS